MNLTSNATLGAFHIYVVLLILSIFCSEFKINQAKIKNIKNDLLSYVRFDSKQFCF